MDYIQMVLLITLATFITSMVFLIKHKIWSKPNTKDGYNMHVHQFLGYVMLVVSICCLIFAGALALALYTNAINLAYKYEASHMTVTETKELLMRHENITSSDIGYGLESLRLKETLEEAIRDKNNLYAKIQGWLNNPLMPYRGLLKENLERICI